MSWWSNLFQPSEQDYVYVEHYPMDIELILSQFHVHVYSHEIETHLGRLPCWSYVTEGLHHHQQKEVIFTLRRGRRERAEAFPRAPIQLLLAIYQLAEQGRIVDAGGVTHFASDPIFDRHLIYIHAQPLPGVQVPDDALAAILITEEEVIAAQHFGVTRVMARLGQAAHYYPCPPWSDRSRRGMSFVTPNHMDILTQIPQVKLSRVYARVENDHIRVTLADQTGELAQRFQQILSELPNDTPFALQADLDPKATGCLVWEPGQSQPAAITANGDNSNLGGSFVVFAAEQPHDEGVIIQDGFGVKLTNRSWQALLEAFTQRKSLTIPATNGGMPLSVDWLDSEEFPTVNGQDHACQKILA